MKINICLLLLICLFEFIFSRLKGKLIVIPRCDRILNSLLCEQQSHCRWSFNLNECVSLHSHAVLVRRPLYVHSHPHFVRRAAYVSRPSVVSRPVVGGISRPAVHLRPRKI
jgi:hypothetical protein